jgi:hypothetical protein
VDAILRRISRAGLRRGMSGEHWAWFALALAAFALRRARRPSEDVTTLELRAGERYVVTLSDPVDRG